MADPLTVPCPDCAVPADVPCGFSSTVLAEHPEDQPRPVHAERQRVADLRAVEHGTCALCGQAMVRGAIEDREVDAWHPDPDHAAACPPIPDARTDWTGHAEAINAGAVPGHPGTEHFRPAAPDHGLVDTLADVSLDPLRDLTGPATLLGVPRAPSTAICPECRGGKHQNCDRTAWDQVADQPTSCACGDADHPGSDQ